MRPAQIAREIDRISSQNVVVHHASMRPAQIAREIVQVAGALAEAVRASMRPAQIAREIAHQTVKVKDFAALQ